MYLSQQLRTPLLPSPLPATVVLSPSTPTHIRKRYDRQQSDTLQLPPEDPTASIYSAHSMLSLHSALDEGTSKNEEEVRGWG